MYTSQPTPTVIGYTSSLNNVFGTEKQTEMPPCWKSCNLDVGRGYTMINFLFLINKELISFHKSTTQHAKLTAIWRSKQTVTALTRTSTIWLWKTLHFSTGVTALRGQTYPHTSLIWHTTVSYDLLSVSIHKKRSKSFKSAIQESCTRDQQEVKAVFRRWNMKPYVQPLHWRLLLYLYCSSFTNDVTK